MDGIILDSKKSRVTLVGALAATAFLITIAVTITLQIATKSYVDSNVSGAVNALSIEAKATRETLDKQGDSLQAIQVSTAASARDSAAMNQNLQTLQQSLPQYATREYLESLRLARDRSDSDMQKEIDRLRVDLDKTNTRIDGIMPSSAKKE